MKWENIELIDREAPKERSWASLCIGITGILAISGFVAFVLVKLFAPNSAIPEPKFQEILPEDATVIEAAITSVEKGYIVAYTRDDRAYLALVRWNTAERRYKQSAGIPIAAGETVAQNVRQIAKEIPSLQGPTLYLVLADIGGAYADAVFVAIIDGDVIRLLRKVTAQGETVTALFLQGSSAKNEMTFRMDDIDADGSKEAIEETIEHDDTGTVVRRDVAVYRFKNNVFMYDQDLSIVMTMRGTLFPEPPQPPQTSSGQ